VLRRLELAARLRDAYWAVAAADSEARVARERLATARDVGHDFQRRVALGDIAETEALLARNEELAAELDLARADAAGRSARASYATFTGGSIAALTSASDANGVRPEPILPAGPDHPQLRAAEAALATAEARARLVRATPIDNPELGFFGRRTGGSLNADGFSLGLRMRVPIATAGRNVPRLAEVEAERTRAAAELQQARRAVDGEITLARLEVTATETARRLAASRRAVADQQLAAARSAFRNGEIGAFDLFRVRQLQIEATAGDARAQIETGRARSRLNQALGAVPTS
jgi:outer membrane protein TolC